MKKNDDNMLHKSVITKDKTIWKYHIVDYTHIYIIIIIIIIIIKIWLLIIIQIRKKYDCWKKNEKIRKIYQLGIKYWKVISRFYDRYCIH